MTPNDIAIKLVERKYSPNYTKHLLSIFRDDPSLLNEVSIENRVKLKSLIGVD